MALVPLSYNIRSLFRRRTATVLTIVSIGATVAVLAGVFALQQGFESLFAQTGREDLAVFMRPGATSEGESAFPRDRTEILIKNTPEIATGPGGAPLGSAELYLAMRLRKTDGGETNVPIRGVQQATFDIRADEIRILDGRRFSPGSDEIIVGEGLLDRIQGAQLDEVILLNTTPFRVVGSFEHDGPFSSEIWGDIDRMAEALERPVFSRVVAQLRPDVRIEDLAERIKEDKQVPAKVISERAYFSSQTQALSMGLAFLGQFLGIVMGAAAIMTGMNTMLAAVSARTHEIGILLSIGYRPFAIFLSFLFEAVLLGMLGAAAGCLMILPLNGVRTGTTNWQTFTEVAFAFRVSPTVLLYATGFALLLGLIGGTWPALRAARLRPTEALRRE